jgi:hypothetical protein
MTEISGPFHKFVRLNLTREIVQVMRLDSSEITIKYREQNLILNHNEISCITLEEVGREKIFR